MLKNQPHKVHPIYGSLSNIECLSNHLLQMDMSELSSRLFYFYFTRDSHKIRDRNLLKFRNPKAVRFNTFILLFSSLQLFEGGFTISSKTKNKRSHIVVKLLIFYGAPKETLHEPKGVSGNGITTGSLNICG